MFLETDLEWYDSDNKLVIFDGFFFLNSTF